MGRALQEAASQALARLSRGALWRLWLWLCLELVPADGARVVLRGRQACEQAGSVS